MEVMNKVVTWIAGGAIIIGLIAAAQGGDEQQSNLSTESGGSITRSDEYYDSLAEKGDRDYRREQEDRRIEAEDRIKELEAERGD